MIAIIPARGGSKGLPGKNIKPLQGKELIGWTIEAALSAKHIDEVILSSDDEEIARIAKKFGASVPFMRPDELATDTAIADDAYIYTINRLNDEFGYSINEFCILQPTSPLRKTEDIDNAIELFHCKKAEAVLGVCELTHPLEWVKGMDKNGVLTGISKEFDAACKQNRQAVSPKYLPNGAIFVLTMKKLLSGNFYGPATYGYEMPRRHSIDIDSIEDFEYAEFLISKECS